MNWSKAVLLLLFLLLAAGLGGWWNARRAQPVPVQPLPKPSPASLPRATPRPAGPPSSSQALPPLTVASPEPGKKPDVRSLLAGLAGPDYEVKHPGVLDRLAAFLAQGDYPSAEREAGAVTYLGRELTPAQRVDLWIKAAGLFPDNLVVADAAIRAAFQEGGSKAEAALLAQLARTPKDAHLLWLQSSLAFEAGHPEEALGFLVSARDLPAWKDLGGMAERGSLAVLDGMGEAPDPFRRFDTLVRYPRPELARCASLARDVADWAGGLAAQGRAGEALQALQAVDRMGEAIGQGSRSLVGFISAQGLREEVLRALEEQAMASGDLTASEGARSALAGIEAERKRFWAWNREYRGKAAERLRPLYERLGVPFHAASALHGVEGFKAREAELLPDERKLLEEAGAALFGEMDAYRRQD